MYTLEQDKTPRHTAFDHDDASNPKLSILTSHTLAADKRKDKMHHLQ